MAKYINNRNKIPLFNKFLSYFYPQKFIEYKNKDIYVSSSIFSNDEKFLYKYKVIEDTSIYENHVYVFENICLLFNRKTSTLALNSVLVKIDFDYMKDNCILKANIGSTWLSNIVHKTYYKFLELF